MTPEERQKLSMTARKRELQFALRNTMNSESVVTKGATIFQTLKSLSLHRQKISNASNRLEKWVPRDTTFKVKIIKDDKMSIKKGNG